VSAEYFDPTRHHPPAAEPLVIVIATVAGMLDPFATKQWFSSRYACFSGYAVNRVPNTALTTGAAGRTVHHVSGRGSQGTGVRRNGRRRRGRGSQIGHSPGSVLAGRDRVAPMAKTQELLSEGIEGAEKRVPSCLSPGRSWPRQRVFQEGGSSVYLTRHGQSGWSVSVRRSHAALTCVGPPRLPHESI
jgi:hypothetical protein